MRESLFRLGIFFVLFILFSILETFFPRRQRLYRRRFRWPNNFGVLITGTLLGRFIPFFVPVDAALLAADRGYGLFYMIPIPGWTAFLTSIILLDLLIYWQHRLFHTVPFLSRFHRMHHTDRDIDATTALRFHPIEIIISLALKTGAVLLLGAPASAVLVFEIMLNGAAMFNHANLFIPPGTDLFIRKILVTPDMHRIHHSVYRNERNSNYGFALSWWDYLFRSYTDKPADGYERMALGISGYENKKHQKIICMLTCPFIKRSQSARES